VIQLKQKIKQKLNLVIIFLEIVEEEINMPTLKHLLEELKKLGADPDEVRIPGQLYDDLYEQAEENIEEEDSEEK